MNSHSRVLRFQAGLAVIVILTSGLFARAQPPGARGPQDLDASVASFKQTMEQRLGQARARIREIAEPVLERVRKFSGTEDKESIINQTIRVQGAEATYQMAKLTREVAEIAIKEYEEGIYVQDRATAEGELRLAESGLKRSTDQIEMTKELLGRVKKAASGSVFDIMSVAQMEGNVDIALLEKAKRELALEQAKSKLKVLEEYEKPKRLKELRSEVEKARSDEFAKEQTLELEKSKLTVTKKQAEGVKMPAKYEPILSLLDEAAHLDHEIRDGLAKLDSRNDPPQAAPRKEIENLAHSLEAKVNEAGRLWEDLKFAELAGQIHYAAPRPAPGSTSPLPRIRTQFFEKMRKLAPEDRAKLRNASETERTQILKKAGFSDEELKEIQEMRERMRGGR